MPHIKTFKNRMPGRFLQSKGEIMKEIMETGDKMGYSYKYYSDIEKNWNYGVDKDNDLKYIDAEILMEKLPFSKRKSRQERGDIIMQRIESEIERKRSKEKTRGLETTLIITIISMSCSIIFLSPNLTGNTIANLSQTTSNWVGGSFFILAIINLFLYFQKKKRENKST